VEGVALRFGLLYGLEASAGAESALLARKLPLFTGGQGIVSWVHTAAAVSALVAALERGRPGEAYNVVDDEPVTHSDFFGAMADALGAPKPRAMPMWIARLAATVGAVFFEIRLPVSNAKAKRSWAGLRRRGPTGMG
jgi:nucleoside-diphosphate-sugar epimerase